MIRFGVLFVCVLSIAAAAQSPGTTLKGSRPLTCNSDQVTSDQLTRTASKNLSADPKALFPDVPLEIIKSVKAVYPAAARPRQLHGRVWLEVYISKAGKIDDICPNDAHCQPQCNTHGPGETELVQAALDAVRRWEFKPPIKDGKPLKSKTFLLFNLPYEGNEMKLPGSAVDTAGANEPSMKLQISEEIAKERLLYRIEPGGPGSWSAPVKLLATIGKDGRVEYLRDLTGNIVDVVETMYAVADWRYQPFQVNGEPVEVETTITLWMRNR